MCELIYCFKEDYFQLKNQFPKEANCYKLFEVQFHVAQFIFDHHFSLKLEKMMFNLFLYFGFGTDLSYFLTIHNFRDRI